MEYDIEVKLNGVWHFCARYLDPYVGLRCLELVHPNVEFRAIPVFKTKYVCR